MKFNPDPSQQAQEIIFSRKKTVSFHPVFYFNDTPLNSMATDEHFGMILYSKLVMEIVFNLPLVEQIKPLIF